MAVKKKKGGIKKRVARIKFAKAKVKVKAKADKVRTKKKLAKKRIAAQKPVIKKPKENVVGKVTHYFPRVRAAAIKLKVALKLGDRVRIKGHTTDFTQEITSLQIDRQSITQARRGQEIGLLVDSRVRRKDIVYRAEQ